MKQGISDVSYINKVQQLVHLAEINFLVCQKIYKDYLNQKEKSKNTFIILTANNAFNESLSILQTMICSTEKNDLRIEPILEKVIRRDKNSLVYIDTQIAVQFIKSIEKDYPCIDSETVYGYRSFLINSNDPDTLLGDAMANIRRKKRVENGLSDFQELKDKFEKFNFHKIRHHQIGHKHKNLNEPAGSVYLLLANCYIDNLEEVIKDLKIKTYYWFDFSFDNSYYSTLDFLDEILKKY